MIDLLGNLSQLKDNSPKTIEILDTTLRDGEQAPGIALTTDEKVSIATELDNIGVSVIEAGSACTGPSERDAIKQIVNAGLNAKITSFARGIQSDIDHALDCGVDGVTLVVPSSDRHVTDKVRTTREDVISSSVSLIEYAKDHGIWVELLGEDGSRANIDFLRDLMNSGIEAGADWICWADTVGHASPEQAYLAVSEFSQIGPTSTHTHDDLGLAMSNVLASIAGGALMVHATVNGIGERSGNVALEEVAIALHHCYDIDTVNLDGLYDLAQIVSSATGVSLPPNKAVIGENAFTHESGIHTDGILKDNKMYEPYPPELVGRSRRLAIGKHVGRAGAKATLAEHGITPSDEQISTIVNRVKLLAERNKRVTDADLLAISDDVCGTPRDQKITLVDLIAVSGGATPTASIRLNVDGEDRSGSGIGSGPVDAAINAVRVALNDSRFSLVSYHVDALTGGTDALVTVYVEVARGDRTVSVASSDSDITRASVSALIDGIDRLMSD
tara:strand:- start:41001 stop:42506 length:1506 start_codon:yes stop_codon:yes gene_type:complete